MANPILHFARTSPDKDHINTLDLRPEVRKILLCEGVEFHNQDKHPAFLIPECLIDTKQSVALNRRPSLAVQVIDDDHFTFTNQKQGVRYEIERTIDRARFEEGLIDPEMFVLYGGHARFGNGPCFANVPRDTKGEFWRTGLFRMGFPFIAMPRHESLKHGYTAPVVPATVSLAAADCEPFLRSKLGSLKKQKLVDFVGEEGLPFVSGPARSDEIWTFRGFQHGHTDDFLVVFAHFQGTPEAPHELGAVDMQCRVFFHCGCSTLPLNQPIVVDRKGFARDADRKISLYTDDLSNMEDALAFLYHLLAYDKPSRFRDWGPAIEHARTTANRDLKAGGFSRSQIKEFKGQAG